MKESGDQMKWHHRTDDELKTMLDKHEAVARMTSPPAADSLMCLLRDELKTREGSVVVTEETDG